MRSACSCRPLPRRWNQGPGRWRSSISRAGAGERSRERLPDRAAVTELLQAKMQLFDGARVLERQRVQGLLGEARLDVSVTGDDAEDLARTLAEGLKLGYTPEQLACAEPAKLDTLRFLVEGEGHLAAGRHRDAIATLQKAMDGNEGRDFAAARRLQGEAYRSLAKASAGEQERAVREEYLKKFKEDALAASGALYDLGLAYEAKGDQDHPARDLLRQAFEQPVIVNTKSKEFDYPSGEEIERLGEIIGKMR